MSTLHYFAYGSNMLTKRLRARVPSARPLGAASLAGHSLSFSKLSLDGSGKATVHKEKNGVVFGVVFELPREELPGLAAAEEAYSANTVTAKTLDTRRSIECLTYYGDRLREGLRPYSWYKAIVTAGAAEHNLPAGYTETLLQTPSLVDPDVDRQAVNEALLAAEG